MKRVEGLPDLAILKRACLIKLTAGRIWTSSVMSEGHVYNRQIDPYDDLSALVKVMQSTFGRGESPSTSERLHQWLS